MSWTCIAAISAFVSSMPASYAHVARQHTWQQQHDPDFDGECGEQHVCGGKPQEWDVECGDQHGCEQSDSVNQ